MEGCPANIEDKKSPWDKVRILWMCGCMDAHFPRSTHGPSPEIESHVLGVGTKSCLRYHGMHGPGMLEDGFVVVVIIEAGYPRAKSRARGRRDGCE